MTNKQNTKQRKKTLENLGGKINFYCWIKLVGVVPSSSTCTRKRGGSANWPSRATRHENEQQGKEATMGGEVFENGKHQGAMARQQQQHGNKRKQ